MTLRTRIRFPWNAAILAIAGLMTSCDQEPPSPEGLCARAASCDPMDVLVSGDSCAQQVRARLVNASPACSECVLGLPCSGLSRIANGKVSLAQICPSCPSTVTAKADCTAPHVLICGIAARPAGSASAAAAAPPEKAIPSALPSAVPGASAFKPPPAPTLEPLPAAPKLPTAPVPDRPQ